LLPARVPALNQFFLVKTLSGRAGYREHLNESNQARNWSFEAGGKSQKEGARRSVVTNMRCSQRIRC